jgi:dihydroorotase-like cyclic amidohydrolase
VLKNVKLYDGETVLSKKVDIIFKKGIIAAVETIAKLTSSDEDVKVSDLDGQFVTPGCWF